MTGRIHRVAQREYLAYVRTRTFLISALSMPIMLAVVAGVMALLESAPTEARTFTLLDETGRYGPAIEAELLAEEGGRLSTMDMREYRYVPPGEFDLPEDPADRVWLLEKAVQTSDLFAFFRISSAAGEPCLIDFHTADVSADGLARTMQRLINRAAARETLLPLVQDEALLDRFLEGVPFKTHAVTAEGGEEATAAHRARAYAPMATVYLLWLTVLMMAGHLLTSTIEEKGSRVIEVLLSAVSPSEFLIGKLLGLAAAGMTMIGVWLICGLLALNALSGETTRQVAAGIGAGFSGANAFWFLGFFLLGFLFFASIFIGIGSVCNTVREAQNLTQPIMFVLMIPILLMVFVTNNPDHIIAVIASFVPPFTPFVIMNRIAANPPAPLWQVGLAAAVLIAATWATVRASVRVFRIGILMYGKPPTLPELVRWMRRSG